MPSPGMTDEEFASFCKTPECIKRLPTGCKKFADGLELYVDGSGQEWTREEWVERYGYDPKPVWNRMKRQTIATIGGFRE